MNANPDRVFLDTNILVYAFDRSAGKNMNRLPGWLLNAGRVRQAVSAFRCCRNFM